MPSEAGSDATESTSLRPGNLPRGFFFFPLVLPSNEECLLHDCSHLSFPVVSLQPPSWNGPSDSGRLYSCRRGGGGLSGLRVPPQSLTLLRLSGWSSRAIIFNNRRGATHEAADNPTAFFYGGGNGPA